MRRISFSLACLMVAASALVGATVAEADVQLGSVVRPAGSGATPCIPGFAFAQASSAPGIPYVVPAGKRQLTRWEVSTAEARAGVPVTLLLLRPAGGGSYDVLATDAETLPTPLPPDGVAAFTPPSPLAVSGGEVLGLNSSTGGLACVFTEGATPSAAAIYPLEAPVAPAPGQTLMPFGTKPAEGVTLNLAATLRGDQDLGVATSASPASVTVGALALLRSTVTNHGVESTPISFTDTVPAGLSIDSAFAGSNECATDGQTVDCTIEGLAAGQSASVSVLVTPSAPGSYANQATVATQPGIVDPAPADDSASARLDVAAASAGGPPAPPPPPGPGPRACVVPDLRGLPPASARRLLRPLGCRPGKVRRAHSGKVARGKIIRTSPKPGTYAARRKLGLVVSAGPRRHGHRHHGRA